MNRTTPSTPNRHGTGARPLLALLLLLLSPPAFTAGFDHFTTGFPLEGAHQRVDCEQCHATGLFRGTPRSCGGCHVPGGPVEASTMPASHMPTTRQCGECHYQDRWSAIAFVDHTSVNGRCEHCHNGVTAAAKGPNHVQSGNRCDDCHKTLSWSGAIFDHKGIATACASCHNGTTATGKPGDHLATTQVCEGCHSTTTWSPVIRMDHAEVTGSCVSCHNGTTATGKGASHMPTSDQCDD